MHAQVHVQSQVHVFNDAGYAQCDRPSKDGYCAARGAQGVLVPFASTPQAVQYSLSYSCVRRSVCFLHPPAITPTPTTWQAKREVARGKEAARKNGALVLRGEQARHITPLARITP